MFLFFLPSRALTSPDLPWFISLLWRSWVVRRILVRRAIASLILAPCRARESAAAARRNLVMSPASSHQAHKAVLVFARARMCGHFSLVRSIKCLSGEPQASFQRFPQLPRNLWVSASQVAFPFLWHNLINGLMWLGLWWSSALWGIRTPFNPKEALVGWSLIHVNSLYPSHDAT